MKTRIGFAALALVLIAVVVTWGAAPAEAIVVQETMDVRAHGTVAPDFTDMAHIHLIWATGSSAPGYHDRGALKLDGGAAVVGQPLPFDVTFPVTYAVSDPWLTWVIVGVYHETDPDTVSVAMEPEENPQDGHWENYFDDTEAAVHGYLVTEDVNALATWLTTEGVMDASFFSCDLGALPADETNAVIRNFTGVVVHGAAGHTLEDAAAAIPEPCGLGVVGLAMLAARRKRN